MGSYIEQRKEKMPKARALYAKGLTAGRIAKILSMSRTTVCRWIANFAEEKEKNMAAKQRNKKKSEVSVSTEIHNPSLPDQEKAKAHSSASAKDESAEQKISRLEKELREARLRADFYEEMINVAEKRFDIQIRKKAGAKR